MSLLFLTSTAFQALDDVGNVLPGARLRFLRSGTTTPQAVYDASDLQNELSDSEGYVTSDAQGQFADIYMATTWPYRVQLFDQYDRLRWDVDPYECTCGDPGHIEFRSPVPRGDAGATLDFYVTETETPTNTYADSDLETPHPNPLKANAAGVFPPVYLDDDVTYRVIRSAPALDTDPYVCECEASVEGEAFTVTVGNNDNFLYGYWLAGDIDPDPPILAVGGAEIEIIGGETDDNFWLTCSDDIRGDYTSIIVEHSGGTIELVLSEADIVLESGARLEWNNSGVWGAGDVGEQYTVTFVP